MATRKSVVDCVTLLCEAFSKTASGNTYRCYEEALFDLTDDELRLATRRALREHRFMPAPSVLRDLVLLSIDERASRAWLVFEKAVMRHGHIRTVTFDEPTINAVVRGLGGWEHCCTMTPNEFDTFLMKKFHELYRALHARGVGEEQAAPLVGWFDRVNSLDGHAPSAPIVIETGLPGSRILAIARDEKEVQKC